MKNMPYAIGLVAVIGLLTAACNDNAGTEEKTPSYGATNPILPYWEYIPDGEPYVFEDPDRPGKYRVYLYGSHDSLITEYCGREQYVWSAPVEDLSDWSRKLCFVSDKNRDGAAFSQPDILYAPDIMEYIDQYGDKYYYFFPNNQTGGRKSMVCRGERPDGPFDVVNDVINWSKTNANETTGFIDFDPAAFQDPLTGKVWCYWGFQTAYLAEADPENNFTRVVSGTQQNRYIPGTQSSGGVYSTDPQGFNFYEASSMRFIEMNGQQKYVLVYARKGLGDAAGYPENEKRYGTNNSSMLAYAYGDAPNGPFTYGGVIIDNGRELGASVESYTTHNNHGSLVKINGQWYIFYHRCINNHGYSRQACVEPVTINITDDGKVVISEVEPTSMGFNINGLDPYRKLSAGSACYYTAGFITASRDETINNNWIVVDSDRTVGFKTFNFGSDPLPAGKKRNLSIFVTPGARDGTVTVYKAPVGTQNITQGTEIGTINVTANGPDQYTINTPEIDALSGKWNIYFKFALGGGSGNIKFDYMQFSL